MCGWQLSELKQTKSRPFLGELLKIRAGDVKGVGMQLRRNGSISHSGTSGSQTLTVYLQYIAVVVSDGVQVKAPSSRCLHTAYLDWRRHSCWPTEAVKSGDGADTEPPDQMTGDTLQTMWSSLRSALFLLCCLTWRSAEM